MYQRLPYSVAERINTLVNANTQYTSDAEKYGRAEFWEAANGSGDCEDYALAKRNILLRLGVPPIMLRLATCWTESNEYHAVLIAITDEGEWVLDNRYPLPMRRQDMDYRWDRMQMGAKWVAII